MPAVGTFLKAASLRVVDRETALPLPGPNQLPVRYVEHHLVPERDGKVPVWWDSYDEPSPTIVVHAALDSSPRSELLRQMIRQYVADGWECSGPEGSVLREYSLEARRELGLETCGGQRRLPAVGGRGRRPRRCYWVPRRWCWRAVTRARQRARPVGSSSSQRMAGPVD